MGKVNSDSLNALLMSSDQNCREIDYTQVEGEKKFAMLTDFISRKSHQEARPSCSLMSLGLGVIIPAASLPCPSSPCPCS